ncbi:MAG: hypothetical protein HY698_12240 [Deltaproteobacteria bacterium]|nr:hypothetical protein [Deltaproteobacteria bacterium]
MATFRYSPILGLAFLLPLGCGSNIDEGLIGEQSSQIRNDDDPSDGPPEPRPKPKPKPKPSPTPTPRQNPPTCNSYQIHDWEQAQRKLGAVASDPVGSNIGWCAAQGSYGIGEDKWFPITGRKETYCGFLHSFGWFRDDNDFNFYLTTDDSLYGGPDLYGYNPSREFEAEISVGDRSRVNACNHYRLGIKNGQPVCAYGPWVNDRGHNDKQEIHPAEMIWWESGPGELEFTLAKDVRGNFDDSGDFSCRVSKPWAGLDRHGKFQVAFEVAPSGPPAEFEINRWGGYGMTYRVQANPTGFGLGESGEARADDGRLLATWRKKFHCEDEYKQLSASVDVCRNPADNRVLGFLNLHMRLGEGGFESLRVLDCRKSGKCTGYHKPTCEIATSPHYPGDGDK